MIPACKKPRLGDGPKHIEDSGWRNADSTTAAYPLDHQHSAVNVVPSPSRSLSATSTKNQSGSPVILKSHKSSLFPASSAHGGSLVSGRVLLKRILVTGCKDQQLRQGVQSGISQIGGHAIDLNQSTFNNSATHLIVFPPWKVNEKILGSVASGIWIVKPAWVTASARAKAWLNEEAFVYTEKDFKAGNETRLFTAWKRNFASRLAGEPRPFDRRKSSAFITIAVVKSADDQQNQVDLWKRVLSAASGRCARGPTLDNLAQPAVLASISIAFVVDDDNKPSAVQLSTIRALHKARIPLLPSIDIREIILSSRLDVARQSLLDRAEKYWQMRRLKQDLILTYKILHGHVHPFFLRAFDSGAGKKPGKSPKGKSRSPSEKGHQAGSASKISPPASVAGGERRPFRGVSLKMEPTDASGTTASSSGYRELVLLTSSDDEDDKLKKSNQSKEQREVIMLSSSGESSNKPMSGCGSTHSAGSPAAIKSNKIATAVIDLAQSSSDDSVQYLGPKAGTSSDHQVNDDGLSRLFRSPSKKRSTLEPAGTGIPMRRLNSMSLEQAEKNRAVLGDPVDFNREAHCLGDVLSALGLVGSGRRPSPSAEGHQNATGIQILAEAFPHIDLTRRKAKLKLPKISQRDTRDTIQYVENYFEEIEQSGGGFETDMMRWEVVNFLKKMSQNGRLEFKPSRNTLHSIFNLIAQSHSAPQASQLAFDFLIRCARYWPGGTHSVRIFWLWVLRGTDLAQDDFKGTTEERVGQLVDNVQRNYNQWIRSLRAEDEPNLPNAAMKLQMAVNRLRFLVTLLEEDLLAEMLPKVDPFLSDDQVQQDQGADVLMQQLSGRLLTVIFVARQRLCSPNDFTYIAPDLSANIGQLAKKVGQHLSIDGAQTRDLLTPFVAPSWMLTAMKN